MLKPNFHTVPNNFAACSFVRTGGGVDLNAKSYQAFLRSIRITIRISIIFLDNSFIEPKSIICKLGT